MDGFGFQGQGEFQRLEIFTTKQGKEIVTMVIDVMGDYPQTVPIKALGGLANKAKSLLPGAVVEIKGTLGGREWNGKIFGEIKANRIEVISQGKAPTQQRGEPLSPGQGDEPF
jgi:hypothetical protein